MVMLGTKELRFGHKALKMVEALMGKSITEVDMGNLKSEELEQLYLCSFNDPSLKLEDMEDILDKFNYSELRRKIMESITEAYGVSEEDEVKKGKKEDKKK